MKTYRCRTCGNLIDLPVENLLTIKDVIRVRCTCGKDFILANRDEYSNGNLEVFTYDLFDGESIEPNLRKLLPYSKLSFFTVDTLLKHCKFNRWDSFFKVVKENYRAIAECQELASFMDEQLLLVK